MGAEFLYLKMGMGQKNLTSVLQITLNSSQFVRKSLQRTVRLHECLRVQRVYGYLNEKSGTMATLMPHLQSENKLWRGQSKTFQNGEVIQHRAVIGPYLYPIPPSLPEVLAL